MMIDGSKESNTKIKSMLHWDGNNGIAREVGHKTRKLFLQ